MKSRDPRSLRWAVVFSALFALSSGAVYGLSDSAYYLLLGHKLADSHFLVNDWLTQQTSHHHFLFGYLVWGLSFLGEIHFVTAVFHLISLFAFGLFLFWILDRLRPDPFPSFVLLLLLCRIVLGHSFLSNGFLPPTLLPGNLGFVLFVGGSASLLARRAGLAGLFLGLSGLIHANFLFLIPPFLFLFLLFNTRRFPIRDWSLLAILFFLISSPTLVISLKEFILSKESAQASDLLIHLRSPHHYFPREWSPALFIVTGIILMIGAMGIFRSLKEEEQTALFSIPRRDFLSLYTCLVLILTGGLFFTAVFFVRFVSLLFPFRLAPVAVLFAFIGASLPDFEKRRLPILLLTVILVPQLLLGLGAVSLSVLISVCGLILFSQFRMKRPLQHKTALFIFVSLASLTLIFQPHPFWGARSIDPRNQGLFSWTKENTPTEAVFIIPPALEEFRLGARRAVIVDWKGFPLKEEDTQEWYRRMKDVTGLESISRKEEALTGYLSLDAEEARLLKNQYGAEYVVIFVPDHQGGLENLQKVYEDPYYAVYQITPLAP